MLHPLARDHEQRERREQRQEPQQTEVAPRRRAGEITRQRQRTVEQRHEPHARDRCRAMRDDRVDAALCIVLIWDQRIEPQHCCRDRQMRDQRQQPVLEQDQRHRHHRHQDREQRTNAHHPWRTHPLLVGIGILIRSDRAVARPRHDVLHEPDGIELPDHAEQQFVLRQRKIEPVARHLGLSKVGIAHRIVDELMMRQMMQTERVRRCVDWECREPIRNDLVLLPVGKEDVVRALVNASAKLMLEAADDDNGENRHRDGQPRTQSRRLRVMVRPERRHHRRNEDSVVGCEEFMVRVIVPLLEPLKLRSDRFIQRPRLSFD